MKAILRMVLADGITVGDCEWPHADLRTEDGGTFFVVTQYKLWAGQPSVAIDRIMWVRAERVQQAWLVPDDPQA